MPQRSMTRDAGEGGGEPSRASWLHLAFGGGVPRRSFGIALVVGTILNLINQGDALVAGDPLDWLKIALTYTVPYCVATYGAVTMGRYAIRMRGARARDD